MKISTMTLDTVLTGAESIPILNSSAGTASQKDKRIASSLLIGAKGTKGISGLTPYQLWLTQSNSGNEAAYQATIKGNVGGPGQTGPVGDDTYHIWLANGHTGSQQDFANSLVGQQGPMGSDPDRTPPTPVNASGTYTPDTVDHDVFLINATGNLLINNPSYIADGRVITIEVIHNNFNISFGDKYELVAIESVSPIAAIQARGVFDSAENKITGFRTTYAAPSGATLYSFNSSMYSGDDNSETTITLSRTNTNGLPAFDVGVLDTTTNVNIGTAHFAQDALTATLQHHFESAGNYALELDQASFDPFDTQNQMGTQFTATATISLASRVSRLMVLGYSRGDLLLYDPATRNKIATIIPPVDSDDNTQKPGLMVFSPNGKMIALTNVNGDTLTIKGGVNYLDWSVSMTDVHGWHIAAFGFSPDSKYLVAHGGTDADNGAFVVMKVWRYDGAGVFTEIVNTNIYGGDGGDIGTVSWKDNNTFAAISTGSDSDNKIQVLHVDDDGISLVHEINPQLAPGTNGRNADAAYVTNPYFNHVTGMIAYQEFYNFNGPEQGSSGQMNFSGRTVIRDNSYNVIHELFTDPAPGTISQAPKWSNNGRLLALTWKAISSVSNTNDVTDSGINVYDSTNWTMVGTIETSTGIGVDVGYPPYAVKFKDDDTALLFGEPNKASGSAVDVNSYVRSYAISAVNPLSVASSYTSGLNPPPQVGTAPQPGLVSFFDINDSVLNVSTP